MEELQKENERQQEEIREQERMFQELQGNINLKDKEIQTHLSEISRLKSKLQSVAERNERLNAADKILKENEVLRHENALLKKSVEGIEAKSREWASRAEADRQAANILSERIEAAIIAIKASNEKIRIDVGEELKKGIEEVLEPVRVHSMEQIDRISKEADRAIMNSFLHLIVDWVPLVALVVTAGLIAWHFWGITDTVRAINDGIWQLLHS